MNVPKYIYRGQLRIIIPLELKRTSPSTLLPSANIRNYRPLFAQHVCSFFQILIPLDFPMDSQFLSGMKPGYSIYFRP